MPKTGSRSSPGCFAGRTAQTGVLVAATIIPETFTPSLTSRSWIDQGVITGFATSLDYLLTVTAKDTLGGITAAVEPVLPRAMRERPWPSVELMVDLALIPAGMVAQRLLARRPDDHIVRGLARQAAWRTARTGAGAVALTAAQAAAQCLDQRVGADGRIARVPVAVPAGVALAVVLDRIQRSGRPEHGVPDRRVSAATWPSIGASGLVVGALGAFAALDHAAAERAGTRLARVLPGSPRWWCPAGHAAFLGLLALASGALFDHVVRGLEEGATAFEPLLDERVEPDWIGATVSGGPGSAVPWATLGREGRRHAFAYVRPSTVDYRPPGVPDLSIATVMGQAARATPVQVYVGLDSAPDGRTRVELAMKELDRTGGWDRSLLMLISPTGTGYVNYYAVAAAEYLTLGDIATVTLQYSKRPSALSLGRIGAAREQNRLLLLHVLERLRRRPADRRPRVVLFGESLGAHTSQDVLMHWGTLGPQALGIDRALWIGTPYASKWMHQVTRRADPDVDPDLVGIFNDFAQYSALPLERRERLRYVLVNHDNDGVTKFGVDLIATRPPWLDPGRPPVRHVPGASPRGIPPAMHWRPLTTFLQTFVDMKNAQRSQAYQAFAHDYRPDLAPFVSAVYDLPATNEQMTRVARALEERETARLRLFAPPEPR
jgi:uncharacterized membrane protein